MKKEIKIIIAGVIFFLFLLTMAFVSITMENGGFTWSLLWDAIVVTMISIGIAVIIGVITYLLFNWIEKNS